ncbi:EamA family transporter RarD [Campylobacter pinnipediorum]|uniref:EamA family transporter RarD n=1 Tax=Campylobacter pinnipediorum TaxID=1965231 RepID=UPI00084D44DB|nr:EamA family transporter RarD [Campylobacter pinnipediorum]
MNLKNEETQGLFLAIIAFTIWGFYPLYFKLFSEDVGSVEILAHRVLWSLIFMGLFLYLKSGFRNIKILLKNKKIRNLLFLSGAMISINWGLYIYAVNTSHIVEASLGYFINPLMNILVGFLIFKEQPSKVEKIAVLLVCVSVFIQIYYVGKIPFISIILPVSMAIYVSIRKFIKLRAIDGLFIETLMISFLAFGYFLYLCFTHQNNFKADFNGILMILSGIVTILPLVMFNAAANRIKLSTLGYIHYLSPTLTLAIAVLVFNESLDHTKIISFILIWSGLIVVSLEKIYLKNKKGHK